MSGKKLVRVTFQGHKLWMYEDWRAKSNSPLIPRHHVDEENECMDWSKAFDSPSFGHVFFDDRNVVRQNHQTIGRADEIVDGWSEKEEVAA